MGGNRFKIHEAVMEMVSYIIPRELILSGTSLRLDFCRASIWADGVEYPFSEDGPVTICE